MTIYRLSYSLILVVSCFTFQGASGQFALDSVVEISPVLIGIDEENRKNEFLQQQTIIKKSELQLNNPQTAADLLGTTGQVFIQKSQLGGGSPMLRGFSTNKLLYVLDGVRLNNATYRGGNLQNVISLDALTMEQTEIIFGPAAINFGSDAMGGVFNFSSLSHQFSLKDTINYWGNALMRYSSANQEQTAHVHLGIHNKKTSILLSFTKSDFKDLKMGRTGSEELLNRYLVKRYDDRDSVLSNPHPTVQSPSGYEQQNFMQKIRYQMNSKTYLEYDFHYSESSSYARYDRFQSTNIGEMPKYATWDYGPQTWIMNRFAIGSNHQNKFLFNEIDLIIAHQYNKENRKTRRLNSNSLKTQTEVVNAYNVNLNLEKKLSKKTELFYGLEYVFNNVNSFGNKTNINNNSKASDVPRYPASTYELGGIYLNSVRTLHRFLKISGGVRWNSYLTHANFSEMQQYYPIPFNEATINKRSLSYSAGWLFDRHKKTVVSGNFSSAFRAPNVDDLGKIFDFNDGQIVVPNNDLEAERAYSLDLNLSKLLGSQFKIEGTFYYTWVRDLMVRRKAQFLGQDSILYDGELSEVYSIQNAASGHIFGLTAGAKWHLFNHFMLESNLNFQKGKEVMESGMISSSRHASPSFGKNSLTYYKNKLTLQFYHFWNGKISAKNLNEEEKQKDNLYQKNESGEPYVPAWNTINLKAKYQLDHFVIASLGIENLLDKRYRAYSSGINGSGRNLILALQVNF